MSAPAAPCPVHAENAPAASPPPNDDPRMGTLIQSLTIEQFEAQQRAASQAPRKPTIVFAGFPHDEGCRRNGGRIGAAKGPAYVRGFRQSPDGVRSILLD